MPAQAVVSQERTTYKNLNEVDVSTAPREELSDGIPHVDKDPTVSDRTLTMIALVRTGILWLVLAAGLVSLFSLRNAGLQETASTSDVHLVLDLCKEGGPVLHGSGTRDRGFVKVIADKERKIISFSPDGAEAKALQLQELKYFESEEQLAGGPCRSVGFSFGLFKANEIGFKVSVQDGNDHECVKKAAQDRGLEVEEPLHFFGEAVADVLKEAERRDPQNFMVTTPRVHGSLLLATGSNTVWSGSSGVFTDEYAPSEGWEAYRVIMITLRVCMTAAVVLLLGRFVYKEWRQALEIWVVQYDYLWQDEDLRTRALTRRPDHDHPVTARDAKVSKEASPHRHGQHRLVFSEAASACSSLFVLDHLLGDPQANAESLTLGAGSALLQGLISLLIGTLPVLHGLFFPCFKAFSFALIGVHLLCTMVFGSMYYFAVPYKVRGTVLKMHLIVVGTCLVYAAAYLVSVILFLLTRLIVDTTAAIGYVTALGSVILYIVLMTKIMYSLREGFIEKLDGKESKGVIIKSLKYIGLDSRTIILTVIIGAVLTLLLAAMLLLVSRLYFESSDMGQWLSAAVTPFASIGALVSQLEDKQKTLDKLRSQILDVTGQVL